MAAGRGWIGITPRNAYVTQDVRIAPLLPAWALLLLASALAVGGGARSDTWLRIIAEVLNRPLRIAADSDVGAALGAARLAICAAEGADPAEVCTQPEIHRTIEPEPALVARYAEGYGRYRRMYPALREILA